MSRGSQWNYNLGTYRSLIGALTVAIVVLGAVGQGDDETNDLDSYVVSEDITYPIARRGTEPEYPGDKLQDELRVLSDIHFNDQGVGKDDDRVGGSTLRDYPTPVRERDWPRHKLDIGEACGVSVDTSGNPYLLHRGDRKWDARTFDGPNFAHKDRGPIKEAVLLRLDKKDGKIVQSSLSNTLYMPHGLTIDDRDNVWITDVALHQVLKFSKGNLKKPSLVLGKKFEPGSDRDHFCQPTDVAVAKNGQFFVSDGYCNHRVIKFSSKGDVITIVGKSVPGAWYNPPLAFDLPHGLTLMEQADMICVADRESFRVVCLRAGVVKLPGQVDAPGVDLFEMYAEQRQAGQLPAFLSYHIVDQDGKGVRPYAIADLKPTNNIYVITQLNDPYTENVPQNGLYVNKELQIDTTWFDFPFASRPHDLTIYNVTELYIADLDTGIWKFNFAPP